MEEAVGLPPMGVQGIVQSGYPKGMHVRVRDDRPASGYFVIEQWCGEVGFDDFVATESELREWFRCFDVEWAESYAVGVKGASLG